MNLNTTIKRTGTHFYEPEPKWLRTISVMFTFGIGFSGFQLLLLGLSAAGIMNESRILTVPYRYGFLAISVIIIIYGVSKKYFSHLGWVWVPLLLFWFLYFFRIAIDGYLSPVPLNQEPIEYIKKSFGMVFIPMFIFLMRIGPKENDIAFKAFWMIHVSCLIFSIIFYRDSIGVSYRGLKYTGDGTDMYLSPIILSYIGVVAAVVSLQRYLISFSNKKNKSSSIFLLTLIGGMVLILFSGTRSALIACIVASTIVLFKSTSKRNKIYQILLIAGAIFVFGVLLYVLMEKIGTGMVSRYSTLLKELTDGDMNAGAGRSQIYLDGINQFIKNPLLGSGLEEKNFGSYPHNHILEAFMATGIIGGISFVILCCYAVNKSLLILEENRKFGWLACIFLIFFIRGIFSAPIINSTFWCSMMAIYAIPIERRRKIYKWIV